MMNGRLPKKQLAAIHNPVAKYEGVASNAEKCHRRQGMQEEEKLRSICFFMAVRRKLWENHIHTQVLKHSKHIEVLSEASYC